MYKIHIEDGGKEVGTTEAFCRAQSIAKALNHSIHVEISVSHDKEPWKVLNYLRFNVSPDSNIYDLHCLYNAQKELYFLKRKETDVTSE